MSISDMGLLPKIAANPQDYTYHYQTTALYLHPLANALFSSDFRFEPSQTPLPVSRHRQNHLPTRPQLLAWFSGLSKEEVQRATTIENGQFIQKFLKNYEKHGDKLIHLPSSRTTISPFTSQSKAGPDLLSKVRVAMLAEPLMYLEAQDSAAAATLEWLDTVTARKAFDLPHRSLNRESPQQNLLWFNSASFHPLHHWLASQLERTILRYFFNPKDRISKLTILSKHLMGNKIGKSYMQALEIRLDQVKEANLEEQAKLIEGLRYYEQTLQAQLQENILGLTTEKKKKKKRRNKREREGDKKIQGQLDQIHTLIQDLQEGTIGLQEGKSLALSTATAMQQQVAKKEYEQRVQFQHTSPAFHQNTQNTVPQPIEIESLSLNFQNITCSFNSTTCTSPAKNEEDELQNEDSCQDLVNHYEANLSDSFQTFKLSRQSSQQMISNSEQADLKHDSETFLVNQGAQLKAKRRRKRKGNKTHNKMAEQFKQKAVTSLLNKQFTSMVDSLSTESNSSYESKAIAFERVQYFVKSLYALSEAVLFGSNAVGLALPSSDIDIMLVHIPCQSKDEICDVLAQIAIYINTMGWVTSCSTYFNAKVPLLKLQIDPSIPYFTPKRKTDYFGASNLYVSYYLDMKQPAKAVPIKVDITISTQQGKVSASTQLMRYWLQKKPTLQRVLLALKYSLSVRGYSQNFKGGIGSYCLFVMVAAYFIHFNETREQSDCDILLDVLKYYGQDFQNQLKIITLSQETSCFVDNESGQHRYEISDQILFNNLLKIIDPLNGKLMSSSCLQYNNIKAEWRRIRCEILKVEELVENEIEMCFNSNAEIGKLLANRKGFDRWVNKLQTRVDFSIVRIIAGL